MIQPPDRPAIRVLDEISVPTLIVVGEHDIPDVHAHCGAISGGIPNAERTVVSGAAHLVPMEKPDVFNQAVRDFIQRQKFFALIDEKGFDEASAFLQQMLDENPGAVPFTENDMNLKGYEALQDYDIEKAITLFRLNVLAYPNAWNTYDSLAEAYLTRGDRDLAIEYYEKSLELNPDNTNATQILKQLK
jgi:tetratricopeptide (TPR) repeat protein